MAKRKKAKPAKKTANPPIEHGANRRAMAVLTRNLKREVEKIEEQEALLARQKKKRFDDYKKDTGRSLQAAKRILRLAGMDPNVRDTIVKDELAILEDLGMQTDMPLFAEASKEQMAVEALEREQSIPGYVEGLGRDAFQARRTLDQHPFPADAEGLIGKWQAGFIAARTDKDEEDARKQSERQAARAEKVAARAAAKAGRNGEASAGE